MVSMVNDMQYDRNKLKAAVLHIVASCDPRNLGAVKLHKALYYSDMMRYADVGNAITGSTYKKRPFGPTCEQLSGMLVELVAENCINIKTVNYFGYMKKEFNLSGKTQDDYLSRQELDMLDEVITFVCNENSARSISELSHARPWESVEFGEVIKYNSVYHIFPVEVSPEAMRWASEQVNEVEDTRSKSDPVDYVDFTAFRKKVLERSGGR